MLTAAFFTIGEREGGGRGEGEREIFYYLLEKWAMNSQDGIDMELPMVAINLVLTVW